MTGPLRLSVGFSPETTWILIPSDKTGFDQPFLKFLRTGFDFNIGGISLKFKQAFLDRQDIVHMVEDNIGIGAVTGADELSACWFTSALISNWTAPFSRTPLGEM